MECGFVSFTCTTESGRGELLVVPAEHETSLPAVTLGEAIKGGF